MAGADMAVVSASERAYGREHWLPYGASALVTAAAIIAAWPLYLVPSFPYLALALVVIGTPVRMYLRAIGFNRRLLNITIVGVSLIYIFATVSRLQLPAGGSLMSIALIMEDRVAIAFVIHMFVTIAMFRSFSLLTDRDLTLTLVPAPFVGVVLFGSAARGEARADSDVDLLLVLAPKAALRRGLYRRWDELFAEGAMGRELNAHFVHLPEAVHQAGSLWLEVAIEGRVVMDREGRVARLLVALRRAIAAGRFVRGTLHGQPCWRRAA